MNKRMIRIIGAALASLLAASADAQSNSLFRKTQQAGQPQPAPTSQPTGAAAAGAAAITTMQGDHGGLRNPSSDPDAPPPSNETLLRYSLIAVTAPPPRKLQVNDQITVIVREDLRSSSDATLKQDKKWDVTAALSDWIRLNEDNKLVPQNFTNGHPDVGFKYDDKYEGTGKTERKDSLVTRIQARVVDVKPNGTLLLEARRRIRTGEDVTVTTLSGLCRSEDVSAQNTVLSTQIYDLNIDNKPEGAAQDAGQRGWIKRLVDFLKPL